MAEITSNNNSTYLNIFSKGSLCGSPSTSVNFLEKISFNRDFEGVSDVEVDEVMTDVDELEGEFCLLGRKYITVLPAVVTNSSKPKTVFLTKL